MIDLPIASEPNEVELHPRILLYNHLQFVISITIFSLSLFFLYQITRGEISIGALYGFTIIVLMIVLMTQFVDFYSWYLIRSQERSQITRASSIYLIPVFIDVLLIFAFGLGIFTIFLRVVIWGNINPEDPYFDEEDPLFN